MHHRTATICALGLALAPAVGVLAADAEPGIVYPGAVATLIDRELRVRTIRIVGLDRVELSVIDERGERRNVPLSELIALVPVASAPAALTGVGTVIGGKRVNSDALQRRLDAGDLGFVETVDGQRLIGDLGESTGDSDAISWMHPKFGPVRIEIDRIRTVAMPAAGAQALTLERNIAEDILALLNGDRLRGLIVGLADPVVIEQDDARIEVAREHVAGVTLANPDEARSGSMVWLLDGTVVRIAEASSIAGDSIDLSLESGAEGTYSMDQLRAMGFDAGRLVPLSDVPPVAQTGEGNRRAVAPIELIEHPDDQAAGAGPTLGAMDIRLPGPMRVQWKLPKRVERLASTIALASDAAPWGDCEVVVLVDGHEIFRDHLESGRSVIAINEPIRGSVLTIVVEPGNHGPINDRVILHRPLLLLEPPR